MTLEERVKARLDKTNAERAARLAEAAAAEAAAQKAQEEAAEAEAQAAAEAAKPKKPAEAVLASPPSHLRTGEHWTPVAPSSLPPLPEPLSPRRPVCRPDV